jgi:hypothetical protein
VEKSVKVDKQQFDRVLGKLIATPPIRSKDLVGKPKQPMATIGKAKQG